MNVVILITDFERKKAVHTTIRLGRELTNRGHLVWFVTPGDFSLDPQDKLWMNARRVPRSKYNQSPSYLKDLLENPVLEPVKAADTDLLFLRDNPSKYDVTGQWARPTGAIFGRMAAKEGVVVVNDPNALAISVNKLYFQSFPREVRPLTLITRNRSEIKEFAQHLKGDMVLKPLQGSGGEGVFLVRKAENYNLNQLTDVITRDGYVIAQEYLPAASEGDLRIFCMNGEPLQVKEKYAAFQRIRSGDDIRSNLHAGGTMTAATVTPTVLRLCELVKEQLIADGLFLVGLDIVGDKIMEINLFCPGGIEGMEHNEGVNFSRSIAKELEAKVEVAGAHKRSFCNRTLATQKCRV
ncbi:MAG: glutathione synthase [Vulcanimicrobiota bacterium]